MTTEEKRNLRQKIKEIDGLTEQKWRATQNMGRIKSKHFDFYANAQYPLIMKQQSIAGGGIKDLFGVSGKEFQEIKSEIAGLQKGELIIKDTTHMALGFAGKPYKKIKVTHLI